MNQVTEFDHRINLIIWLLGTYSKPGKIQQYSVPCLWRTHSIYICRIIYQSIKESYIIPTKCPLDNSSPWLHNRNQTKTWIIYRIIIIIISNHSGKQTNLNSMTKYVFKESYKHIRRPCVLTSMSVSHMRLTVKIIVLEKMA